MPLQILYQFIISLINIISLIVKIARNNMLKKFHKTLKGRTESLALNQRDALLSTVPRFP